MALWSLQQSQQGKDWKTQECPSQHMKCVSPPFAGGSSQVSLHFSSLGMSPWTDSCPLCPSWLPWTPEPGPPSSPRSKFKPILESSSQPSVPKSTKALRKYFSHTNNASQRVQPGFLSLPLSLSSFPQTILSCFCTVLWSAGSHSYAGSVNTPLYNLRFLSVEVVALTLPDLNLYWDPGMFTHPEDKLWYTDLEDSYFTSDGLTLQKQERGDSRG